MKVCAAIILATVLAISGAVHAQRTPVQERALRAPEEFLAVERFARLSKDQQEAGLSQFYTQMTPGVLNDWFTEGNMSSWPADIFTEDRNFVGPGDRRNTWVDQLAAARITLSPQEISDRIMSARGSMILRVVTRREAIRLLLLHQLRLNLLVAADLASPLPDTQMRGIEAVRALHLNEHAERVTAIYLAKGPNDEAARWALHDLRDPLVVEKVLADLETHPQEIVRHFLILNEFLRNKPAPPVLLKLLESDDSQIRAHSASAVSMSGDPALAKYIPKLLENASPSMKSAVIEMAHFLPNDSFETVRAAVTPLMTDPDPHVRAQATGRFANRRPPSP